MDEGQFPKSTLVIIKLVALAKYIHCHMNCVNKIKDSTLLVNEPHETANKK